MKKIFINNLSLFLFFIILILQIELVKHARQFYFSGQLDNWNNSVVTGGILSLFVLNIAACIIPFLFFDKKIIKSNLIGIILNILFLFFVCGYLYFQSISKEDMKPLTFVEVNKKA